MAYKMYLDGVLMPITPSKVKVKINNQNETLTLISGEEINILKAAGLTDVSFDLLLPQVPYPFTNGGAQPADYYLSLFERLKTAKEPFQWILNREKPNGSRLFYTNLTVGMEDYQITDDAEEGFDITVTVSLKQYRHYGTKTVTIQLPQPRNKAHRHGGAAQTGNQSGPQAIHLYGKIRGLPLEYRQEIFGGWFPIQ